MCRSMTQQTVSPDTDSGPPLLPTTTPTLNNIDYHPHENHNPPSHSALASPADTYAATNGPSSLTPHPKHQRFRVRTTERGTRLESSHSDNEVNFSRTLRRRELRGIAKPEHSAAHTDNLDPITTQSYSSSQRLDSLKELSTSAYSGHKTAINGSMKKKRSLSSESHTVVTKNHRNVHSEVSGVTPKALVRASVYSKDDSHVLRSRTASSPREKPYIVNHRVVDKS